MKGVKEEKRVLEETVDQLKSMNQKREDEIFWALVNQVNELKGKIKE